MDNVVMASNPTQEDTMETTAERARRTRHKPDGARGMSMHHQEQLLDAVMHYVDPKIRGKVIAEVPAAYNDYCGWTVVEVTHADGRVTR